MMFTLRIYLGFRKALGKAFDYVPHQHLLSKLKAHSISGSALKWVTNFLSNRQQRVYVNTLYSDWSNVTSDVPQGSVFGPLLRTSMIYLKLLKVILPSLLMTPSYKGVNWADFTQTVTIVLNYIKSIAIHS